MKIDLGNFGFQQRQVVDARVDRGDPTVQAKAMQNVAEAQLQQATRANEAWAQVGKSVQALGNTGMEIISEKAKLDAANNVQRAQLDFNNKYQELTERAQKGEITSDQIMPEFQKFKDSYKPQDISGLGPMSSRRYEAAMSETKDGFNVKFEGLRADTHRGETKIALDTHSEQHINTSMQNGLGVGEASAYFDDPQIQAMAREAYGPEAGRYLYNYKQKTMTSYAAQGISQNANNGGWLQGFRANLNDPKGEYGTLDVDHRLQLDNQIAGHLNHLQAVAQANQAHADAVARQRETNAQTVWNNIERRQREGQIIPPEEYAQANSVIQGTNFGRLSGGVQSLQANQQYIQEARNLPPDELDRRVHQLDIKLDSVGGTDDEYKQRNALKGFQQERERQLQDDPKNFGYHELRMPAPKIDFNYKNLDDLTVLGNNLNQSVGVLKATQDKHGERVKMAPLSTAEVQNLQAKWDNSSPELRTRLAADLRSVTTPETFQVVMNQLKDVDKDMATIMSVANTKDGFTLSKDMQTGTDMIKKGAIKPPKDEDILAAVDSKYGNTISPEDKQNAVRTIKPILVARGVTADNLNEDTVHDLLDTTHGQKVKITTQGMYGMGTTNVAYAIAPPGMDGARFAKEINDGLNALPGVTGQNIRNGLDNGSYQLVPDRNGHYVVSDGRQYVPLGNDTNYLQVSR